MIFFYTGQPGHGKTLHGIEHACEFRDSGRPVYVCNVRGFDHAKARMHPMTPEEFKRWPEFLPDGAVCLVDEVYESGMLTKLPPSVPVPHHIERLATHRHKGIDFIFICQSPDKQTHHFVQDLIDRHVHVRRRFGTSWVHLRTFDKFERNPEKATPLLIRRRRLPKKVFGLYQSTELDTTERRIPWYFIAAPILLVVLLGGGYFQWAYLKNNLSAQAEEAQPSSLTAPGALKAGANGAPATVAPATVATTGRDYKFMFTPRIAWQPWTAPAYDEIAVPAQPPRIYCMSSGEGSDQRCSCLTDQGTRYAIMRKHCLKIARYGQYEPLIDSRIAERERISDLTQYNRIHSGDAGRQDASLGISSSARGVGLAGWQGQQTRYGQFRADPLPADPVIESK